MPILLEDAEPYRMTVAEYVAKSTRRAPTSRFRTAEPSATANPSPSSACRSRFSSILPPLA